MQQINIACGDSYVEGWQNFDYAPHSSWVRQANLLGRLPVSDSSSDIVYSSHFIEHIPKSLVVHFISESFRITKSGGKLRLVLPDWEELCGAYLACRQSGAHAKADFLMLEMLDQCVRVRPGGELGQFYTRLQAPDQQESMVEYVRERTGHVILPASENVDGHSWRRAFKNLKNIHGRFERLYCKMVLAFLPAAFKDQNVSFSSVGERHAWMYDFHSVERLLREVGFAHVRKMSATTSMISDFPFFPLDLTQDGRPRKGVESMYIEAIKP
jgi:SAM-dependent methyltransferase